MRYCNCGEPATVMGLCTKCYNYSKAKPKAKPCTDCGKMTTTKGGTCRRCCRLHSVCDCGGVVKAKGLCETCYNYKHFNPGAEKCIICNRMTTSGICKHCSDIIMTNIYDVILRSDGDELRDRVRNMVSEVRENEM